MKSRLLTRMTALTLFAILALPVGIAAQDRPTKKLPFYSVTDLGTLGGAFSVGVGINTRGLISLNASTAGNAAQHVALWRSGNKTDLDTLGGPNSNTFWRPTIAAVVTGFSDTSTPDPLGTDFCSFGTQLICRGFVWRDGVMSALPTLGGNNSLASAINDFGLVGGYAENTTLDKTCARPQYEAKPVLWDKGIPQELPTPHGDRNGFIFGVNNKGQAVGGSSACINHAPSLHALLWRNGVPTDLGNLGGKLFTNALSLNDEGMVIGFSDLPGDTNYYLQPGSGSTGHAYLWSNGVMTDLGALPGDVQSFPNAINNRGQVVGAGSRAILWQDGKVIDLNTLVPGPPFSPMYLLSANGINDRGEIVGLGLAANGDVRAFLAVPCNTADADAPGCASYAGNDANLESNPSVPVDDTVNASERIVPRLWRPAGTPAWLRTGAFPGHQFSQPSNLRREAPSSVPAN